MVYLPKNFVSRNFVTVSRQATGRVLFFRSYSRSTL
ncbi:Uncharacterised protein [Segatella buccae]|uniref:Uncharacterized protein n=1 Tax=Segatella buccae TaxID=28126 RepID=A0AAQ1UI09_9BACT|nr:Uncharacterised protein [Segatella buccae]